MISAGDLPCVARLLENGTMRAMRTALPVSDPCGWASLATGTPVYRHGLSLVELTCPSTKMRRPSSPSDWLEPPVWERLESAGKKTITVGWPGTHQDYSQKIGPDRSNAVSVSLYFASRAPSAGKRWGIEQELAVLPEELRDKLARTRTGPEAIDCGPLRELFPGLRNQDLVNDPALARFRSDLAEDFSRHEAMRLVLDEVEWDFATIIYQTVARASERAMAFHEKALLGLDPALVRRYQNTVKGAYRWADRLLTALIESAGGLEKVSLVLVSSHGFAHGADRPRPRSDGSYAKNAGSTHKRAGVFITSEEDWGNLLPLGELKGVDLLPLILSRQGLPVPEDVGRGSLDPLGDGVIFEKLRANSLFSNHDRASRARKKPKEIIASCEIMATSYLAHGMPVAALPFLEKIHLMTAASSSQNRILASARIDAELFDEAAQLLAEPENVGAPFDFLRGRLEMERDNPEKSLAHFESARRALNGHWPLLSLKCGEAHESLGEIGKARIFYEKASQGQMVRTQARLRLARLDLLEGKAEKPGDILKEIAVEAHDEVHALSVFLRVLWKSEIYPEAVDVAKNTVAKFPTNLPLRLLLQEMEDEKSENEDIFKTNKAEISRLIDERKRLLAWLKSSPWSIPTDDHAIHPALEKETFPAFLIVGNAGSPAQEIVELLGRKSIMGGSSGKSRYGESCQLLVDSAHGQVAATTPEHMSCLPPWSVCRILYLHENHKQIALRLRKLGGEAGCETVKNLNVKKLAADLADREKNLMAAFASIPSITIKVIPIKNAKNEISTLKNLARSFFGL